MTGQNQHLERIRRAVANEGLARSEMAAAAKAAKDAKVPVDAIAEALGFKTRAGVYRLIERGR